MATKPDTAALAAALIAKHTKVRGPQCTIAKIISHPDPVEHAEDAPATTIAAALSEATGLKVTAEMVRRHTRRALPVVIPGSLLSNLQTLSPGYPSPGAPSRHDLLRRLARAADAAATQPSSLQPRL